MDHNKMSYYSYQVMYYNNLSYYFFQLSSGPQQFALLPSQELFFYARQSPY